MNDFPTSKEALYNIGVKAAITNSSKQLLILNIRRKNEIDTYGDLPGGRMVDGETPEHTLRREVNEETGITNLHIDHHVAMATSGVTLPGPADTKIGIIFSVYQCQSNDQAVRSEERVEPHWVYHQRSLLLCESRFSPVSKGLILK